MKKQIAFVFAAVIWLLSNSTASAQVRFGIKAGLNWVNSPSSSDYDAQFESTISAPYNPEMKLAFHFGAQAEFDLSEAWGLSTGLQLSGRGTRYDFVTDAFGPRASVKAQEKPLYLQMPVALTYRKNGFFAGVGPYLGIGIGGELEVKVTVDGESSTNSQGIDFGNGDMDFYRPLDYGVGGELGYEFKSFRVTCSYQHGIAKVVPKDQVTAAKAVNLEFSKKLNAIGISLAYFFQKGKKKEGK